MPAKTRLPSARCGSYSSRSSIVAVRGVEIFVALEALHGLLRQVAVRHRMAQDGDALAGLAQQLGDAAVVWLLPEPVRTAQTATTGLDDASIVSRGESRRYDAPAASAREPMCITCSCVTSE